MIIPASATRSPLEAFIGVTAQNCASCLPLANRSKRPINARERGITLPCIVPLVASNGGHGHHAWPKFMGGPGVQDLVKLPGKLHGDFHGELYRRFHAAGIRKPSNVKWMDHFADNPDDYQTAIGELYVLSSEFDTKYLNQVGGYTVSLVQQIIREMRNAP